MIQPEKPRPRRRWWNATEADLAAEAKDPRTSATRRSWLQVVLVMAAISALWPLASQVAEAFAPQRSSAGTLSLKLRRLVIDQWRSNPDIESFSIGRCYLRDVPPDGLRGEIEAVINGEAITLEVSGTVDEKGEASLTWQPKEPNPR